MKQNRTKNKEKSSYNTHMVRIKYGVEVSDILICRNENKMREKNSNNKNLLSNDKSLTANKTRHKNKKKEKDILRVDKTK